jgi:glucan phosphoethanolaminetransferase (alkaline phosphatase superfamily)
MRRFKAGMLYFVIVFGTGFILGLVRVPFLVPRFGERYAELAEMPIMLVVIVITARHIVRRYALDRHFAIRLQVGFLALALAVTAELFFAALIQSRSVAQYIASRDPASGSVYILLLLVFALMPAMLVCKTSVTRE